MSKERVETTAEEREIVFAALMRMQAEADKVFKSADKLGLKNAANSVIEFRSKIDVLKNKFL